MKASPFAADRGTEASLRPLLSPLPLCADLSPNYGPIRVFFRIAFPSGDISG
ncbi:hypothetical protein FHS99_002571 [Sphingomonas prati]|uniref:Uncharacterized protein n=1 Tax=Sphingomonas prati TaxID=1843237 RepID=A0A7W9BUT3_9SPHN|nr:hypothetical protein [Sphingomonas prati]